MTKELLKTEKRINKGWIRPGHPVYSQWRGKKLSEEHKKKIGKSNTGIFPSEETSKKRSMIAKELKMIPPVNFGKDNTNWNGGKSLYYFRKQALLRDDFTCQMCGFRDEEIMQVDHIKPKKLFPELKFDLSNALCLCPNCHERKTIGDRKWITRVKNNGRLRVN